MVKSGQKSRNYRKSTSNEKLKQLFQDKHPGKPSPDYEYTLPEIRGILKHAAGHVFTFLHVPTDTVYQMVYYTQEMRREQHLGSYGFYHKTGSEQEFRLSTRKRGHVLPQNDTYKYII